jgi:hypothetical protein
MPDGSIRPENDQRDVEFIAAIRSAESLAYGSDEESSLGFERARAIDDYLGRPYGNEVEGRSQVVSRDVYDTIEWIKPSLMRIFTGGDDVAQFDPVGPEDEEQAQQESDYINHVLLQKNNWFSICYEWFTDALMTKNAYAMAYWDNSRQVEKETYKGIDDNQLTLLTQDESVEVVEHQQYPMPMPPQIAAQLMAQGQPIPNLHDVSIKRVREYKGVKVCVLPPERVMVSESVTGMSVKDADFFEYWEMRTISEIRSMGFEIDDDINDDAGEIDGQEDQSRDQFNENWTRRNGDILEPSSRKVCLRTLWIKYDYDGDGIAERRMVMKVGTTILYNEESTGIQVACIVPTPLSHRHPGLSVRDMITDLQLIKTTIWRQTLDNLYLANNGRYGISDKVNLDDMLTSRPGGVVRVANGAIPNQEIFPLVHPFVAGQSLEVLNYTDQIIEHRTGTNQSFTGVDPNALSKSHSGVAIAQLSSAAAQRVELIARVFAEGVKELVQIVHQLCIENHHKEAVVKLRNTWVTVNPSEWKTRQDLKISVGLGSGNKEQLMMNLSNILKEQKEGLAAGVTEPQKIYNALTELTKAAGFPNPEKFWTKPPPGPMPQQPSPEQVKQQTAQNIEAIRTKGEIERTKIKEDYDLRKSAHDAAVKGQVDTLKIQANHEENMTKMAADYHSDVAKSNAMSKPSVQIDTGQSFNDLVVKIDETAQRQEQNLAQFAQLIQQAVTAIAQASQAMAQAASQEHDEIIVRDKSGRAMGKKRAPAGTLQ